MVKKITLVVKSMINWSVMLKLMFRKATEVHELVCYIDALASN